MFRLAIAADLVMALSDAGFAILLYLIFRAWHRDSRRLRWCFA